MPHGAQSPISELQIIEIQFSPHSLDLLSFFTSQVAALHFGINKHLTIALSSDKLEVISVIYGHLNVIWHTKIRFQKPLQQRHTWLILRFLLRHQEVAQLDANLCPNMECRPGQLKPPSCKNPNIPQLKLHQIPIHTHFLSSWILVFEHISFSLQKAKLPASPTITACTELLAFGTCHITSSIAAWPDSRHSVPRSSKIKVKSCQPSTCIGLPPPIPSAWQRGQQ